MSLSVPKCVIMIYLNRTIIDTS